MDPILQSIISYSERGSILYRCDDLYMETLNSPDAIIESIISKIKGNNAKIKITTDTEGYYYHYKVRNKEEFKSLIKRLILENDKIRIGPESHQYGVPIIAISKQRFPPRSQMEIKPIEELPYMETETSRKLKEIKRQPFYNNRAPKIINPDELKQFRAHVLETFDNDEDDIRTLLDDLEWIVREQGFDRSLITRAVTNFMHEQLDEWEDEFIEEVVDRVMLLSPGYNRITSFFTNYIDPGQYV